MLLLWQGNNKIITFNNIIAHIYVLEEVSCQFEAHIVQQLRSCEKEKYE